MQPQHWTGSAHPDSSPSTWFVGGLAQPQQQQAWQPQQQYNQMAYARQQQQQQQQQQRHQQQNLMALLSDSEMPQQQGHMQSQQPQHFRQTQQAGSLPGLESMWGSDELELPFAPEGQAGAAGPGTAFSGSRPMSGRATPLDDMGTMPGQHQPQQHATAAPQGRQGSEAQPSSRHAGNNTARPGKQSMADDHFEGEVFFFAQDEAAGDTEADVSNVELRGHVPRVHTVETQRPPYSERPTAIRKGRAGSLQKADDEHVDN
ncbi:hypothetical protein WJX72_005716 [[Myrmecia] bisecta]|uniref:Uncharacterized protein n=1 Tax=[Myrmecia] bisecta TaxID=41462 RepID=A0AAW1PPX2_9CHLO